MMLRTRFKVRKQSKAWVLPLILLIYIVPCVVKESYLLYLMNYMGVFMIGAVGLDILGGLAGQHSLGHAAFMAIGSYTLVMLAKVIHCNLLVLLLLAGLVSSLFSLLVGLLAIRVKGVYLALATLGFSFIVEEIIINGGALTGGSSGLTVSGLTIGTIAFDSGRNNYFLIYTLVIALTIVARVILNSKLGRAFISIRDSEIAAEVCGVNLVRYKLLAFIIGCFYAGISGGVYAVALTAISPDSFTLWVSIEYLAMMVVGGIGTIFGSILGVIFIVMIPEGIRYIKDFTPGGMDQTLSGAITSLFYGVIMLTFIIFEPKGIYGLWETIREYFNAFPLNEVQIKRAKWIKRWV